MPLRAHCTHKNADSKAGVLLLQVYSIQPLGAQTEHQPAAATALPGKI
jgi:hypothetical protein